MSSSLPAPRYSVWQAVSAALAAAVRALEEVRALSRQPGPQGERGAEGPRGKDAFQLEDIEVTSSDGGRTFVFAFKRGDLVVTREVKTEVTLDCGVWRPGTYTKGDSVTWGGSVFIAQRETTAKPETPEAKDDWRLSVKRGRDGRDGKPGEKGLQGPKGERGEQGPRAYGG